MADRKIIAVVGATGAQGGGLVRAIAADPGSGFVARAITRDVHSDKARALAQLGAEVVAGDVDDAASLARAFEGAHGARVFVDPRSLRFLEGTTLDYDTALISKGFVFANPNAKATCGCGTSFSVSGST